MKLPLGSMETKVRFGVFEQSLNDLCASGVNDVQISQLHSKRLVHANDALLDVQRVMMSAIMSLIHFVLGCAACRWPRADSHKRENGWRTRRWVTS
jgi:hypothetical protein